MAKEFKYEIIDHIADLGEQDNKGWGKEVNIIRWGNAKKPTIDIRKWNRSDDENIVMGKGCTLNPEELRQLQNIDVDSIEERYFSEEE